MATPNVVPKLPLSKNKNYDNFPSAPHQSRAFTKNSSGNCGFTCDPWCSICVDQMKHGVYNNSEFVRFNVESIEVNSPPKLRSHTRRKPELPVPKSNSHCQNVPDPNHFNGAEENARKLPLPDLNPGSWSDPTAVIQEKYLREVEALRGKLRELRGATPRKLPTPPTHSKLKPLQQNSTVSPSDANCVNDSLKGLNSTPSNKVVDEEKSVDNKRTRRPSDSEFVVVPGANLTSTKRHRDHLQPHPKEDSSFQSSTATEKVNFPQIAQVNGSSGKMATTCIERENGEHYTIRLNRTSEISCSISSNSNDNRFQHNSSPLPHMIEKQSPKKEFSGDLPLTNGRSTRSSSFSVGTSSSSDLLVQNSLKHEPLSLPTSVVSSSTNSQLNVEPIPSSASLNSVTASTDSSSDFAVDKGIFRPSLFSFVPPYVKFTAHNEKANHDLPKAIQKALKWKLSTITPLVVRHTVTNSGFRLVKRTGEWGGIWGRHMKSVCFKTLYDYQKINHVPGTFHIGRKDRLWRNVCKLMLKFGKKEFGFLPRTYVLPQDGKALRQAWDKSSKTKWIVKPPAAARGTGIKVINKWTQIPKKCPVIVQKYISNPYLINGNKFDLRLYVLVTSFHPLKIYLYTNGLVRFASVKYSDDNSTIGNRYMHLTNYSINKLSNNYAANEDAEACVGHKWTIKSLWSYLEGSVNVDQLWNGLVDLVVKTMISGEGPIVNLTNANLNSRYSAYELFGVDVLLDENLKPWLLEVNISPSLHSTSPLDIAVKGPMVKDLLNIAGYHIPDKFNEISKDELCKKLGIKGPLCYDSRLYVPELSPKEKSKQSYFCEIAERDLYVDSILEDLTPDDVRHLIIYEDELTQIGSFQKVFPTTESHEYFQYFDDNRYYNMLFDAWETKYHDNRSDGVELLESKCLEQIHLDISENEPRQFAYCPSDYSIKGEDAGDVDGDTTSIDSGGTRSNSYDPKEDFSL